MKLGTRELYQLSYTILPCHLPRDIQQICCQTGPWHCNSTIYTHRNSTIKTAYTVYVVAIYGDMYHHQMESMIIVYFDMFPWIVCVLSGIHTMGTHCPSSFIFTNMLQYPDCNILYSTIYTHRISTIKTAYWSLYSSYHIW